MSAKAGIQYAAAVVRLETPVLTGSSALAFADDDSE
jgi:hypothetical protein